MSGLILGEEQEALVATVRALLHKQATPDAVRRSLDAEVGYDTALWTALVEQIGVAALVVPEEHDGVGATDVEACLVLEEVGRSLAPSPLLASYVAARALRAADEEGRARLLPRVAAGEVATVALASDLVLDGAGASLVLAVDGDTLVEVDSPDATPLATLDPGIRVASLAALSGPRLGGADAVRAARRALLAGGVASMLGVMQRGLDQTVAYVKEREQFGRPIGSFQAVKHRLADLFVLVESSRTAVRAAASALASDDPDVDRLLAVAGSYVGDAAAVVARETVQLHGGIAITWEHDAHLAVKRLHALSQILGQPHHHRADLALGSAP